MACGLSLTPAQFRQPLFTLADTCVAPPAFVRTRQQLLAIGYLLATLLVPVAWSCIARLVPGLTVYSSLLGQGGFPLDFSLWESPVGPLHVITSFIYIN